MVQTAKQQAWLLPDESATLAAGAALAGVCAYGAVVWLRGTLGAGKTTLSRGWLQALGHVGAVKSPTYTLVEPYALAGGTVYHFDLYRINDPDELELMGIRDYFSAAQLCLIEWPEQAGDLLPPPDLSIELQTDVAAGRMLQVEACSVRAAAWLTALAAALPYESLP
ncbi:MAG: tRNA (adenosine(37)-N6)-threonylcarbamoyltransferase complex ATPase subunit type 1 TsaE [Pseudomonadales bacterium]|nr:tRNA (adenosine(37)-N6)-threonylcarbamoyltransferase complex ATPase subunit type 1 TsaE [Pseudomonadales bacterium]